jgi:D-3-phosphoglycerate dehydrogenase / 2-oxoglutarate reductase
MYKILISAPYFQPVVENYRHVFDKHDMELLIPEVNERMSEDELLQVIEDIDGVIGGDDRFTKRVLECAGKLKVISKWGTGIDSIDLECASQLGIAVCNTPGAFTQPVSDSVLGYILCFARKLPWMDQDIRAGIWHKRTGAALHEGVLGIIGVGNIGKEVARKASAFGMKLLGNDLIEMPAEFVADIQIDMVSFDEILREADYITLNCTMNSTSYHIIDKGALEKMKSTAFLINTARGGLIDENALAEALKNNQLAGAALDVFEEEPLASDSSLRELESCLLAPHNSNSSPEAWLRVHRNTLDNLLAVLVSG